MGSDNPTALPISARNTRMAIDFQGGFVCRYRTEEEPISRMHRACPSLESALLAKNISSLILKDHVNHVALP